ncbi:lipocalin family protein [Tenacibaculum sp. 1B UA]|uniref:lipocalin family protein n=1 Tax=unclassified Tenacibaculum TaxID=2635139 RepID=UPI0026E36335|nr:MULTISPECIES: lipocalin family protein [unclassified Tenacibaculum]MDO6674660.1 lipocalin family protein [Tenacibaculum sp. 1_MG-2023]MDX8553336.1 lipocalin family protein [Tenacibaculum sp. 1B UA]
MKKILVLTIALFSLLACSSDDENNLDPIVGTWYKFSINEQEVNDCEKNTTIKFSQNGTFTATYSYYNGENTCLTEETFKGTWTNKGNNNYTTLGEGDDESSKILLKDNNTYQEIFTEDTPDGTTTAITTFKKK